MSLILTSARFHLFQVIEWVVNGLQRTPTAILQHHFPVLFEGKDHRQDSDKSYLWVFASTIGELNAIQPFLIEFLAGRATDNLVILTDHPHYSDAFLRVFPQAVIIDHGLYGKIDAELNYFPPYMFFLAEIPCLLSDAPCRFSYRVVYQIKRRDVPVVAVNGWLYGGKPSCRMDVIQQKLLHKDYLRVLDLVIVQTDEVREDLLKAGANPEKVVVTGNTKYDALDLREEQWIPPDALKPLIEEIKNSGRPIITAGCVTNISEQEFVLDAFKEALKKIPDALLVLAPRHPENINRMAQLANLLQQRSLTFSLRSIYKNNSLLPVSVLVLDSIGELKYLYAIANICFVGVNHNVLEPLAAGKPVIVTSSWEKTYPSYPIYRQTLGANLVVETCDTINLTRFLVDSLIDQDQNHVISMQEKIRELNSFQGVSMKNLEILTSRGLV